MYTRSLHVSAMLDLLCFLKISSKVHLMTRGTVTEEMFHWAYMKTWWGQIRDELVAEDVEVDGRLQVAKRKKRGPAKQFCKLLKNWFNFLENYK